MTLLEIRDLIKKDVGNFEKIKRFIAHMCREDLFDDERHQNSLESLKKLKHQGLAGLPHFRIASKPSFLQGRSFSEKQPSLWDAQTEDKEKASLWQAAVNDDARVYKEEFEKHAQFVFSHTQHHWHHQHDGERIPHPYCRKKGVRTKKGKKRKRGCEICKQDFPKTRQLNLIPKVICPGHTKLSRTESLNNVLNGMLELESIEKHFQEGNDINVNQ